MNKMNEILFLPLPRSEEDKKWTFLQEKLRRKKERFIEGIRRYGTTQEAMIYAGIKSRGTLTEYRRTDPLFAEQELKAFEEKEDEFIDLAIKQLYLKVQSGEMRAITYILDRRSKKFKPKQENENNLNLPAGAGEITVTFKDYSNDNSAKPNIQTVVSRET